MAEDIKTGAGLTLDAEIIVDSNAKPLQESSVLLNILFTFFV